MTVDHSEGWTLIAEKATELHIGPGRVKGRCPNGCGETLFLGAGGYVTCSWIRCPEPEAASNLLSGVTLCDRRRSANSQERRDG